MYVRLSMEPKVTIVFPNWNGFDDTVECLTSLRTLDYKNYNIVIVDNGSKNDEAKRLLSGGVFIKRGKGSGGEVSILTKKDSQGLSIQIRYNKQLKEGFEPEELPAQLELQRVYEPN